MAYLYRHIRIDKNEPFYVGIGEDVDADSIYKRANENINRNKWWKNIVSKTAYRAEILLDNLTWEEACVKEKEFIKLYGRKDLGLGSLINLTDGGDGKCGVKDSLITRHRKSIAAQKPKSEKWKISQSLSRKGKPRGKLSWLVNNNERSKKISQSKKGIPSFKRRTIIQLDLEYNIIKEWPSVTDAFQSLGKKGGTRIIKCCKGTAKTAYGFIWKYKI